MFLGVYIVLTLLTIVFVIIACFSIPQDRDRNRNRNNINTKKLKKMQRIQRALQQPIYLLDATYNTNTKEWKILVQGYSGSNYELLLGMESLVCGCPDYQIRNNTCKHLYFIFGKVLDFNQNKLLNLQRNKGLYVQYPEFNELLHKRLTKKQTQENNTQQVSNLRSNEYCVICFEEFGNDMIDCNNCKNVFHSGCLRRWLKRNEICPLCREIMVIDDQNVDPLKYFSS